MVLARFRSEVQPEYRAGEVVKIRPYKETDLPILKEIYTKAGYNFDFPNLASDPFVGHVLIVVDEEDVPMMAAAVKSVPEIILLCAPGGTTHPLVKNARGISLIHETLRKVLTAEGHDEAFAFLPPEIERNYGRHLMRKFGWLKTWAGYRIGRQI